MMIQTIFRQGNSNAIRIPRSIMKELGLSTNDEVNIETNGNQVIISKIVKPVTIDELFKNYKNTVNIKEELNDKPVGKEML